MISPVSFKSADNKIPSKSLTKTIPDSKVNEDKKVSTEKLLGLTLLGIATIGGLMFLRKSGSSASKSLQNDASQQVRKLTLKDAKPFQNIKKRADGTLIREVTCNEKGQITEIIHYAKDGKTIVERKLFLLDDQGYTQEFIQFKPSGLNNGYSIESYDIKNSDLGFRKAEKLISARGLSKTPDYDELYFCERLDKKTRGKVVWSMNVDNLGRTHETTYGQGNSKIVETISENGQNVTKSRYDSLGNLRKQEFYHDGNLHTIDLIDKKGRKKTLYTADDGKIYLKKLVKTKSGFEYSQKFTKYDPQNGIKEIVYEDKYLNCIGRLKKEVVDSEGNEALVSTIRLGSNDKKLLFYNLEGKKDFAMGMTGGEHFHIEYDPKGLKRFEKFARSKNDYREKYWEKGELKKEVYKNDKTGVSLEMIYDKDLRYTEGHYTKHPIEGVIQINSIDRKISNNPEGWQSIDKIWRYKDGSISYKGEKYCGGIKIVDGQGRLMQEGNSKFTYNYKNGSEKIETIIEENKEDGFKIIYKEDFEHPIERYLLNKDGGWDRVRLEF